MENNRLGEVINIAYGVTQGRKSSTRIYSFHVSDMPKSLDKHKKDFMDPHNLGQLADDTTIYADNFESLKLKFMDITPILINSHDYISAIEFGKSHKYLGMYFIPCSEMIDILLKKLK